MATQAQWNGLMVQMHVTHERARQLLEAAHTVTVESRRLVQESRGLSRRRAALRRSGRQRPAAPTPPAPAPHPGTPADGTAPMAALLRENAHLKEAKAGWAVVDQARGVLMAVAGCGTEEAWQILLSTSQHANVKLRRVAEMVVASTHGADVEEPAASHLRAALAAATADAGRSHRRRPGAAAESRRAARDGAVPP
ncbi:ANTAR domain-containing protein [Streptomyces silvensis]|nr:ANTAR domain-containing protein [Streptomyces silvensis]